MNYKSNLLIKLYNEIKKSLILEYVDATKIRKEKYRYRDIMIQDVSEKMHILQNQ